MTGWSLFSARAAAIINVIVARLPLPCKFRKYCFGKRIPSSYSGAQQLDIWLGFIKVTCQSNHDSLTAVLNRRGIQGRLHEEHSQAQRYGDSLAIGMVDIDHFKEVNDTYCHQIRDDILSGFTIQLQESFR